MSITQIYTCLIIICFIIFIAFLWQFIKHLKQFLDTLSSTLKQVDIINTKVNKIQSDSQLIINECNNKIKEIKKLIPWAFILLAFKRHYEEAKENNQPKLKYCLVNTAKDAISIK